MSAAVQGQRWSYPAIREFIDRLELIAEEHDGVGERLAVLAAEKALRLVPPADVGWSSYVRIMLQLADHYLRTPIGSVRASNLRALMAVMAQHYRGFLEGPAGDMLRADVPEDLRSYVSSIDCHYPELAAVMVKMLDLYQRTPSSSKGSVRLSQVLAVALECLKADPGPDLKQPSAAAVAPRQYKDD